MKVLVVDDDEDQLSIRCMLISHHGYATVRASDAVSALRLASANVLDVAIVDIHLPTLEAGLALLSALKASRPGIYLIVLTGTDPGRLQRHPEMRLVDEVLQKGSSARQLLSTLKRVSEQHVA